jgi:hypothetical protein
VLRRVVADEIAGGISGESPAAVADDDVTLAVR